MPVGAGVGPVVDIASAQERLVLAVGGDELAQPGRLLHGPAHQRRVLHAAAVVGEGADLRGQPRQIGQLPPRPLPADAAVGHHAHLRRVADARQLRGQVRRTVRRRGQVRHGADGGIAAPGRRRGARRDGLFIRKTRLTEVHMHIGETGK